MKKRLIALLFAVLLPTGVWLIAVLLSTGVFTAGCGGSNAIIRTLAIPSIAAIRTALGTNNPYGMIPGLALGEIVFPVCTTEDGAAVDFDVIYSIVDLPVWLSFDATTRAVTLADDAADVPPDAYTAVSVIYTCTDNSDPTVTSSTDAFAINDLDGGGVVDGREYQHGAVPLLSIGGWFWLTPANLDLYRPGTDSFRIPTAIVKAIAGMDPTNADDDGADFDGDVDVVGGGNNADEITNNTDLFVYSTGGTFSPQVSYDTGARPDGVVTGDYDGDGDLDLAVTNNDWPVGTTLSILLGNGDGTFAAQVQYDTGVSPDCIVTGDFDGNGDLDLAVANIGNLDGTTLSVLLGNGDGTFAAQVTYDTGTAPDGITTGDFDGDGDLDLAVANYGGTTLSVLLGNGDGTFAAQVTYDTGAGPASVTTGDFDGDGYLDLAATNYDETTLSVLLGNGDGTFAAQVAYDTGVDPASITTGDYDGDGYLDLAVANYAVRAGTTLSVLLGNGDGTFATQVTYDTGIAPSGIITGDFDGDGYLDLAVTNYDDSTISILMGNGDGTFAAQVQYDTVAGALGIISGDFDEDGALDLAVTNFEVGGTTISVFLNQ